jgi:hypothetical protein
VLPGFGLIGCAGPVPQNPASTTEISADDIRFHVNYLASDELEGRQAGSRGERLAGRYIASEFKRYGLKPAGTNGYFQPFEFVSDVRLGPQNALQVRTETGEQQYESDRDFRPLSFSANGAVDGGVVFVGYGISADSLNYDDYANIDVEGKVVLMLRYGPEGDNPHSAFDRHASLIRKVSLAASKGAAAVLIVTGPADNEEDELVPLKLQRLATASIPAISVTRKVANALLTAAGTTVEKVQQKINSSLKPNSFEIRGVDVALETDLRKIYSTGRNVLAFLEGSDPALKREVVIIGAHYDHLGYGGEGSLARDGSPAIHNGADDNASGTSAVLELAQRFAAARDSVKRSLLFAAFSAEELGLLGSAHYVNKPVIPLAQTVAMLNLDMVGRLKDSTLVVMGVGTSPVWPDLLEKASQGRPVKLNLRNAGTGPSDHSSFYLKDIPVLFFFTGQHQDYHKPSDDPEKINADGEAVIAGIVYDVALALANAPERVQFTKLKEPEGQQAARRGFRVFVGTVPDYTAEGVKGMRISGVSAGSPAEKAGLQSGDVIVRFGKTEVQNIYDYMYALGEYKAGDKVPVTVLRDGKEIVLWVTLKKR